MSRQHRPGTVYMRRPTSEEAHTMRAVADSYCHTLNVAIEKTAEVVTVMNGYILQRIEQLNELMDGHINSPFSQKLRNRSNHVVKACEEFLALFESNIDTEPKRQAYMEIVEIVYPALDSLFEDLHRTSPEPSYKIIRRSKLRCHEPYKTAVKEQTAAFEDGYCKGYLDCVADIKREIKALENESGGKAVIGFGENGKAIIRKIE